MSDDFLPTMFTICKSKRKYCKDGKTVKKRLGCVCEVIGYKEMKVTKEMKKKLSELGIGMMWVSADSVQVPITKRREYISYSHDFTTNTLIFELSEEET